MAGNLKRTATPPASVSSHCKQLRIYDFIADTSYPTSALGHHSILTVENDLPIDVINEVAALNTSEQADPMSVFPGNFPKRLDVWISDLGRKAEFQMNIFTFSSDGGVYCLLCRDHDTRGIGNTEHNYGRSPAFPTRRYMPVDHLKSAKHEQAIKLERLKRSSVIDKIFEIV